MKASMKAPSLPAMKTPMKASMKAPTKAPTKASTTPPAPIYSRSTWSKKWFTTHAGPYRIWKLHSLVWNKQNGTVEETWVRTEMRSRS